MLDELELVDHQLVQQPADVRARREPHAGERLVHRRRPTDALASLQHQNTTAGARQIRRARQPVVSCSHDNDIPLFSCQGRNGLRKPDATQYFGRRRWHYCATSGGVQVLPNPRAWHSLSGTGMTDGT